MSSIRVAIIVALAISLKFLQSVFQKHCFEPFSEDNTWFDQLALQLCLFSGSGNRNLDLDVGRQAGRLRVPIILPVSTTTT